MSSLLKRLRERLAPRSEEIGPEKRDRKSWDEFSGREEEFRKIPWGRVKSTVVDEEEEFFGGNISISGDSTTTGLTSLPAHSHTASDISPIVNISPVTDIRYLPDTGQLQMQKTTYSIILLDQGDSTWSTWTTAQESCDEE